MSFFRVLEGKHYGEGPPDCDCPACSHNLREDERSKKEKKEGRPFVPRLKDHQYVRGDIIQTESNLLEFNQGKAMKFELVDKMGRPVARKRPKNKSLMPVDDIPTGDGLDDLTVDELRSLAAEEEIDVTGLSRKSELIDTIRKDISVV